MLRDTLDRLQEKIDSKPYRRAGKILVFCGDRINAAEINENGKVTPQNDSMVWGAVFGNNIEAAVDAAFRHVNPVAVKISSASPSLYDYLTKSGLATELHLDYPVYIRSGITYDRID